MADNKATKIIEILIPTDTLIASATKAQKSLNDLKIAGQDVTKMYKDGQLTAEEYAKKQVDIALETKTVKNELSAYTKEIQSNMAAENEKIGYIDTLKARLAGLTAGYYSLNEAQFKGAEGEEFKRQINETTEELKKAEEGIGIFNRSVGDYKNSINSALGLNKGFIGSLSNMTKGQNTLAGGFKSVGSAAAGFGKQLLALAMNPVVAILGVTAIAIMAIQKAMESSRETMNRVNVILAPLNVLFDGFRKVLVAVVGTILSFVEAAASMLGWIMKLAESLPFVGKYIAEINEETNKYIELEKDKADLRKKEAEDSVKNSEAEKNISKLKSEIARKDKFTTEQRLEKNREAIALEEEILNRNKENAEERLRIAKTELALDEDDADKKKAVLDLTNELNAVSKEYYDGIVRLERQASSLTNEIASAAKAAADEAKKRRDTELKEIRAAQDAQLANIKDSAEKQREVAKLNNARLIEDLQARLKNETGLTKAAREALNSQIISLQEALNKRLNEIDSDQHAKQIENYMTELEIRLLLAEENTEKSHALRLEKLDAEREAALKNAEETGLDTLLIEQKYMKLRQDEDKIFREEQIASRKEAYDKEVQQAADMATNRILLAGEEALAIAQTKEQIAIEEQTRLLEMDAETKAALFDSEIQYQNAVLEGEKKIQAAKQYTNKVIQQTTSTQLKAASSIAGSMSDLFSSIAGESQELAIFSKALALVSVTLNLAEAIAKATAAGAGQMWPTNIVAIASGIAAVVAAFAGLASSIKSQKIPSAPKFHEGGIVPGVAGTEVPAILQAGEAVIPANMVGQMSPMLQAMGLMDGNGVSIQNMPESNTYELMKAAMTEALNNMPVPVLLVQDYVDAASRVNVLDRMSKL